MFFKLTTLIVLLSFISIALSAIAYSSPSVHPDHPGKCWDSKSKKAYDRGHVFTDSYCTRVTCRSDFSFDYATCGVIGTSAGCHIVDGDLTLEYPLCCPTIECDD